MMKGIVVHGRVQNRPAVESRTRFAQRLVDGLKATNRLMGKQVRGRFDVTSGVSEFVGFLSTQANPVNAMLFVGAALHPNPIRAVAVRGKADVINREPTPSARRFDGPAFQRARALLDGQKGADAMKLELLPDPRINAVASQLTNLLYLRLLRWTSAQMAAMRQTDVALTDGAPLSQTALAKKLDISQGNVSNRLRNADWRAFGAARAALFNLLGARSPHTGNY